MPSYKSTVARLSGDNEMAADEDDIFDCEPNKGKAKLLSFISSIINSDSILANFFFCIYPITLFKFVTVKLATFSSTAYNRQ